MSADYLHLRAFATSHHYCGLELSPLMVAIVDASEGIRPTSIDDEQSVEHFGCPLAELPSAPRRTVAVRAGGRGGKTSRLLAPKAIHAAWTVPLPTLRPGEVASALLIAPDLKLAKQILSFVRGYVEGSRLLSRALVGEPTQDGLELRRPDGKTVRIEVLAATRAGRATRGRTLVFAGLDEACFMYDEATGVVNDADIYRSVLQRVVPGGQVWIVSTPWLAETGLLESLVARDFGRHEHALVCTAGTRALNPTWDPDGTIEADLRAQDPTAAAREIDGVPLAAGANAFFDPATLKACTDDSLVLPRTMLHLEQACAGGDFGFKSDSSALAIVHKAPDKIHVADLLEVRPADGAPLKPSEVVGTFAVRLRSHAGLTLLMCDGHYEQSVREHLTTHRLGFIPAPAGAEGVAETYVKARALMREGRVRLPNHPRLLAQLKAVQWRPNAGGSISIVLPKERAGGHCDLVSALVLAIFQFAGATFVSRPKPGTPEYAAAEAERVEREALQADIDTFVKKLDIDPFTNRPRRRERSNRLDVRELSTQPSWPMPWERRQGRR